MRYDFLMVGAGRRLSPSGDDAIRGCDLLAIEAALFGSVMVRQVVRKGFRSVRIDGRDHFSGNRLDTDGSLAAGIAHVYKATGHPAPVSGAHHCRAGRRRQ